LLTGALRITLIPSPSQGEGKNAEPGYAQLFFQRDGKSSDAHMTGIAVRCGIVILTEFFSSAAITPS
jgi:hypothetical protein